MEYFIELFLYMEIRNIGDKIICKISLIRI